MKMCRKLAWIFGLLIMHQVVFSQSDSLFFITDITLVGNAKTKDDILLEDSRLESFPPFINGRIYNFNKRINENGGNDYWESGVVNPHLILKDLIAILHPDAIPNHEFYYYRQVE